MNPVDLAKLVGTMTKSPTTTPTPILTSKANEFVIEKSENIPVKSGFELGASVPLGGKTHLVEKQIRELELRRLREKQKQRALREKRLLELRKLEEQQQKQLEMIRKQKEQILGMEAQEQRSTNTGGQRSTANDRKQKTRSPGALVQQIAKQGPPVRQTGVKMGPPPPIPIPLSPRGQSSNNNQQSTSQSNQRPTNRRPTLPTNKPASKPRQGSSINQLRDQISKQGANQQNQQGSSLDAINMLLGGGAGGETMGGAGGLGGMAGLGGMGGMADMFGGGAGGLMGMMMGGGEMGGLFGGAGGLGSLLGGGGAGGLGAMLGGGGAAGGAGGLDALLGGGGAAGGAGGLDALLGGGGASGGAGGLDALLGGGGAAGAGGAGGLDALLGGQGGSPNAGGGLAGGAAADPFAAMAGAGAGAAANLLNPMGPGRPFIPGMDANQVADLMGGRAGPVPMDIANEALMMRQLGHTPDHIADVLGDKLQRRFSNPLGAAADMALANALAGGGGAPSVGGRRATG
ncbi:hypothetical protein ACF0H5_024222 [Mactra antiquata]